MSARERNSNMCEICAKEFNCECVEPQPDGDYHVGQHEGRYQHCLGCAGRIWD